MANREDWFKAAASGDSAYIAQHLEAGKGSLTDRQETAMMFAAQAGHEAVVRILLNYETLYVNQDGDTALMLAARQNNATICKLLATREDNPEFCKSRRMRRSRSCRGISGFYSALRASRTIL